MKKNTLILFLFIIAGFFSARAQVVMTKKELKKEIKKAIAKNKDLYLLEANNTLIPLKLQACQNIDSLRIYQLKQKASPDIKNINKIQFFQNEVQSIITKAERLKLDYKSKGINYYILEDLFSKNILEKKDEVEIKDKFMFLNATNFDFNASKISYVAHFNIYAPAERFGTIGLNAGIMKINYSQDSIIGNRIDKVLINPLDELQVGSKYKKMYNRYKTKNSNTSYSVYIQPLLKINSEFKKSRIFFHGHLELLITKFTTNLKIDTIQTKEITIADANEIPKEGDVQTYFQDSIIRTKNYLNSYIGLGLTWDIFFAKESNLFFQMTGGYTTNYPQEASVNNTDNINQYTNNREWNPFYLVRANYRQKLSTGSELIIGTDIRGLFPIYQPYYALYAGVNLSFDKITDLFKQ